jgi:hypothetical protein
MTLWVLKIGHCTFLLPVLIMDPKRNKIYRPIRAQDGHLGFQITLTSMNTSVKHLEDYSRQVL